MRKRIKNTAIYLALRLILAYFRRIPARAAEAQLAAIGRWCWRLAKGERRKTLANLAVVYGGELTPAGLKDLGERVFESLGRSAAAALRIEELLETDGLVAVEGIRHLETAVASGRGVLALTGHIGCWELMAAWVASRGFPLAVVGRGLYDPRLDTLLVRHRERHGLVNLNRDGAARRMLQWLRKGGVVGVLIDQDTGVQSEYVNVMGTLARTPVAPMLLAQRAGSVVLAMAIHRSEDGTHLIRIGAPLELDADGSSPTARLDNLQRCNDAVEAFILENPEQWVWMHERWRTRPGG